MKTVKKSLCLALAFVMLFTFTACRKVVGNGSSYLTEIDSQIIGSEDEMLNSDGNVSAGTSGKTGTKTSSTSSSQSHQSGSEKSNHSTSGGTAPSYPPYSGSLPTVSEGNLPQFSQRGFNISGFWAPYEISEASFKQYKDVGFTELAMINHSLRNTSDEQFYLGSKRTMKSLEICRKVGLKAILNYNDWKASACEGSAYYGSTPFSKHDIYGEYKDIITGIHICDEPFLKEVNGRGDNHIDIYGNKTLIDDFKKVYPNARFIVNLIPMTALESRGYSSYEQMMQIVEEKFMAPFANPYVSVDVYPFHKGMTTDDGTLAVNYRYIAESAKKFNVKPAYILQSSTNNDGEFEPTLSESDLRWEINSALAFGADTLQYYCYSVPKEGNSFLYDKCILNKDNTPSDIYYSLQKLHREIQSFSNVILAYNWDKTIGTTGYEISSYRVAGVEYNTNFEKENFDNPKHYVDAKATHDLLISRFTNSNYGEAYMFVNFADRGGNCKAEITLKHCKSVAVYGGAGFSGTPKIQSLDSNGNLSLNLAYGEGVFVIPLA